MNALDGVIDLPPSPLRERAGVRVAATPTTHPQFQQPSPPSPRLNPSPGGEGRSLPRTRSGGEGSSAREPRASTRRRTPTFKRRGALHPLQGERQIPASSPEIGEGSSAHPTWSYPKVSLEVKGQAEGLPRTHPLATASHAPGSPLPPSPLRERAGVRVAATPTAHPWVLQPRAKTRPLFLPLPMGEGRGEDLPARFFHASTCVQTPMFKRRDALHPLQGERQIPASSPEIGEGSSAHPTSRYARFSREEGLG